MKWECVGKTMEPSVIQICRNVRGLDCISYLIFTSLGSPKQASVTYVALAK